MTGRKALSLLVLLLALAPLASKCGAAQRAPNIIVVLVDDLGYADLGFQGSQDIPTPNLDRLARSGLMFTSGYVSHPFCSPTRAGLMTGRYQQRYGHENNPVYDPKDDKLGLPPAEVTLAQLLKQRGYETGLVGKWHLGAAEPFHPMQRGFTEMFGFLGGGHDYFKTEMQSEEQHLIPLQRDGQAIVFKEYLTDELSREAVTFVRRHHSRPFFLYLAYNAPHVPLQASEKYLARFAGIQEPKRKFYAAMISAVDDGIGMLLGALEQLRLRENTLIFFLVPRENLWVRVR